LKSYNQTRKFFSFGYYCKVIFWKTTTSVFKSIVSLHAVRALNSFFVSTFSHC